MDIALLDGGFGQLDEVVIEAGVAFFLEPSGSGAEGKLTALSFMIIKGREKHTSGILFPSRSCRVGISISLVVMCRSWSCSR